jgi:hypothetical protein
MSKRAIIVATEDEAREQARAASKAAGYPRTCTLSTASLVAQPAPVVVTGYTVRTKHDGSAYAVVLDDRALAVEARYVDVDGKAVALDTSKAVALDSSWNRTALDGSKEAAAERPR